MSDSLKQRPVFVSVAVVIIGMVLGTYVHAQDGWEKIGMIIALGPMAIVVGAWACVMVWVCWHSEPSFWNDDDDDDDDELPYHLYTRFHKRK